MNAVLRLHDEEISLRSIARQALRDSSGKTKEAIDALVKRLQADKRLMREIVTQAIVTASTDLVEHQMRSDRQAVVVSAARARDGVMALANGIKFSILDFTLAGGLKLRDATPPQVNESIRRYESISRDVSQKARWLRLIVKGVPMDKRVGDVITEERAQELFDEASK